MKNFRKKLCGWLAVLLALSFLLPAGTGIPAAQADGYNLALNKPAYRSSDVSAGRVAGAVDGDVNTYWQPHSSDRSDDKQVWMYVDFGQAVPFNEVVLNFRTPVSFLDGYRLQISDDAKNWTDVYAKTTAEGISQRDTALFPTATSRYLRLLVELNDPDRNFQLNELEVYNGEGPPDPATVLSNVYFVGPDHHIFSVNETIPLQIGGQLRMVLNGTLANGAPADLSQAEVRIESSAPNAASAESDGTVTARGEGVAKITGRASMNGITKETSVFVDVYDPVRYVAELQLVHPRMTIAEGQPALLSPGDVYPALKVTPALDGTLTGELVKASGEVVYALPETPLAVGVEQSLQIPGTAASTGGYELRLTLNISGKAPVYQTFYFTVTDSSAPPSGQSSIVYTDPSGKLVYVPDYLGNRVLDFSNSGYQGGGVKIPDVQARVVVEPDDGDDTARIQEAIDRVSQMPMSADGIRGAVLLKKGTYEIGGTLRISASGVVLRGEGQGPDGTVLYATGTAKRNILEIMGTSGPKMLTDTRTPISDLYLPSGTRTFHVDDAGKFKVGDQVIVQRHGNSRWIHAIGMDQIYDRPGTVGETKQWTPFDLNFERVITAIDGNRITVDAPLANSFDIRYGGGHLYKYEDFGRIEQVGVENLRVDVEFDPSITGRDGNGNEIYVDENHAENFVVFDNVKNGWVRDVTALHLSISMVSAKTNAKWITIQDSRVEDMVSTLDGGRRYAIYYEGQQILTQRTQVDSARHAFIVSSRVEGPNVFLDSVATNNHNTTEPHHRWSVGGLFDNVNAPIAIQDRGWLGSGHGWAGANWVAWNTEGSLALQKPPTAQNYAIGFTGAVAKPYLPNGYDPRPREDGYWDHLGAHVLPRSLYLAQLKERLGEEAVQNISQAPNYGGELDIPKLPANLPQIKGIKLGGNRWLENFSPDRYEYDVMLPAGTTEAPEVRAHDNRFRVEVVQADGPNGVAILKIYDKKDPNRSLRYTVRFHTEQ